MTNEQGATKMSINELTLGQLQERLAESDEIRKALNLGTAATAVVARDEHWKVGKNYFIRTVTHHLLGKLLLVTPAELVLVDVSWIADDGRFNEMLATGKANEVEPYSDGAEVIVGRGSLIDATQWTHALLRSVK